jgi:2-amino-4-hydroxy-6-hydroxymethyldihydropteridine diphosphokinase
MNSNQVLIGLGSNLGSPVDQINQAIDTIARHPAIQLLKCSSLYQSLPQGPQDQDNYINAVISIKTSLMPQALLAFLQTIEQQQGRIKTRHWGERCIDLDILFISGDNSELNQPNLIIPHPYALQRDFVVIPALEIEPEWLLPNGSRLSEAVQHCLHHDLQVLHPGIASG